MENHFLASANTCKGFVNCFDHINYSNKAFTYILKGGPGTGKSTIMKNFGKNFQDKGYDVEYFYCSSDIESLDGVRIPKKQIAIVDGTAPHITEATIPGIKEKILNVGAYIKEDIKLNKKSIEKHLNKKNYHFALAYSYLKTAGELFKTEQLLDKSIKKVDFTKLTNITKQTGMGSSRKLFASNLSPNGINFIYNKNNYQKKIILHDSLFSNYQTLEELSNVLKENNYNFICFLSIFDSSLIEAIYIENTNTIIFAIDPDKNILDNFYNKKIMEKLLKLAGQNIAKAKEYHKKVENYYIKYMDFEKLSNYINAELYSL